MIFRFIKWNVSKWYGFYLPDLAPRILRLRVFTGYSNFAANASHLLPEITLLLNILLDAFIQSLICVFRCMRPPEHSLCFI